MEKGASVKDIIPPGEAEGVFAVSQAAVASSRTGPYWRLTLADATGSIEAVVWPPLSEAGSCPATGELVRVGGRAGLFRDQPQLRVERLEVLDAASRASLDPLLFLPAAPRDPDEMFADLTAICRQEFTHRPWRRLVFALLDDEDVAAPLRLFPAARSVHHAYTGGLLHHTLGVMRIARDFAAQYPELDRQTLLAGALLHDIGKIREFSGGLANDYTGEGRLFGHLMLGVEIILPHLGRSGLEPHLAEHLKHLILSHHGELAYGAVRLPQTAEAFALHYADNMDARMAQCRTLCAHLSPGPGWTAWERTLERQIFRPEPTPAPARERGPQKREQCLSLLKE